MWPLKKCISRCTTYLYSEGIPYFNGFEDTRRKDIVSEKPHTAEKWVNGKLKTIFFKFRAWTHRKCNEVSREIIQIPRHLRCQSLKGKQRRATPRSICVACSKSVSQIRTNVVLNKLKALDKPSRPTSEFEQRQRAETNQSEPGVKHRITHLLKINSNNQIKSVKIN